MSHSHRNELESAFFNGTPHAWKAPHCQAAGKKSSQKDAFTTIPAHMRNAEQESDLKSRRNLLKQQQNEGTDDTIAGAFVEQINCAFNL
jgi:hypothetical protein